MPFDGSDRRKHPRRPYLNNIYFCLNPHTGNETLLGVSTNICDSGICIYTFTQLEVGQDIFIRNELPVPYQKATVQWVKKYHNNFYKVGLMFGSRIPAEDEVPLRTSYGDTRQTAEAAMSVAEPSPEIILISNRRGRRD